MLHQDPVKFGPLVGDVYATSMSCRRQKRRRKYLPQSSSSDAPTATAQGYQAPVTDMTIVQEETKDLFGPQVILTEEDQARFLKKLPPDIPPPMSMNKMSWMDNRKLLERHGRFRIAYYKAVKPESGGCKLTEKDAYSEDEIRELSYFEHLENEECFDWFFHTDDIWNPDLDDYQRIVLRNFTLGCIQPQYDDVDDYHERYHTYDMDVVYVKYYGEISKKIKWIKAFLHLDKKSPEWTDIRIRGWRQALRIATQLPDMTLSSAALAYDEYISELRKDESLKDLDLVLFEIWRRVVKDNKSYMDALKEVYEMDKFHTHKRIMEAELNKAAVFVTMRQKINYITRMLGLIANTEDDKARDLFRKGLDKIKTKNMVNYAEKKREIAERLNLHKRIEVPGRD